MNPMAVMSLLGLLKDGLTPGVQDLTAGLPRDLNAERSMAFLDALRQPGGSLGAGSWANMGKGYLSKAGYAEDRASQAAGRSTSDLLAELLRSLPQIQDAAASSANAATEKSGSSMVDLARLASARNRANIENRLAAGGGFDTRSGGTLAAIARGSAEPLLQAETAAGQAYGNAFQDVLARLLSGAFEREIGRPQEFGQVAQGYTQVAGTANQFASLLAQLLGQQSEQQLLAPQLQTRPSRFDQLGDAGTKAVLRDIGNGKSLKDILGL